MLKIYTTKTCAPCKTLKYGLDKEGIAYEVIDVTDDYTLAAAAINAVGMIWPIVEYPNGAYSAGATLQTVKRHI
jgi:mycoredoxin